VLRYLLVTFWLALFPNGDIINCLSLIQWVLSVGCRSEKSTEARGNRLLDIGEASAEAQIKVYLARIINGALQDRGLRQNEAARLLQVRQPKISALANYRLTGFSLERLLSFLNALGWDVQIVVSRQSGNTTPGIHIAGLMPRARATSKGAKE